MRFFVLSVLLELLLHAAASGAEPPFTVEDKTTPGFTVTNRTTPPKKKGCNVGGAACLCGDYCGCTDPFPTCSCGTCKCESCPGKAVAPAPKAMSSPSPALPPGALLTTSGEWVVPDPQRPGGYVPYKPSGAVVSGVTTAPAPFTATSGTGLRTTAPAAAPSRVGSPATYPTGNTFTPTVVFPGVTSNCGPLG